MRATCLVTLKQPYTFLKRYRRMIETKILRDVFLAKYILIHLKTVHLSEIIQYS
jgi:hypothetical protein